jgi:hypothetical protein
MRALLAQRKNEHGFVLAMVAICLGALMLFVGFGVDVSTWYLRASQMQRAADASSLAAAAKMPDVQAATEAARQAASKNGFVDGEDNVSVVLTPILPNKFHVEINDADVESYFAKAALDHISLNRQATGEFLNSVPLGSPYSWLGTGDLPTNGSVPTQNYWLSINGWCSAKEDGDLFSSYWDGTKGGPGSKSTSCPTRTGSAGAATRNDDYNAEGYSYVIDLPVGASAAWAEVYDAGFNQGMPGSIDASAALLNDAQPNVTTTFSLLDTLFTDDIADDKVLERYTFDSRSTSPDTHKKWFQFTTQLVNTSSNMSHKYRVKVQTKADEQQSWGVNSFGIRAVNSKNSAAAAACDSRKSGSEKCPRVYGANAMSVFASLKPGTGLQKVTFYLAQVDPGYAGDPMTVSLWDPGDPTGTGEGGKSISLIDPDGKKQKVHWSAVPNDNMPTYSGYEPDGSIDISQVGTPPGQPNTRYGSGIFNDRRLDMTFQIPTDYPETVKRAKNDWWMIEYTIPPTSSPADRATWSVTISGSDPVHLVRD